MMKAFIFILATYLLALLVIPCSDTGGGLSDMWHKWFDIEHAEDFDHGQHSNSCDDDHCSPFCVCSCCSIVLDSPEKLPVHAEWAGIFYALQPGFNSSYIPSSFLPSIWQPPRLS